jgi:hypothetical protein
MIQSRALHAACAFFLAVAASGCGDDLPTALGPDRFPAQARLASFTLDLPAEEFLEHFGQFDGYSSRLDLPYLIAANQFDGGLNARILLRTLAWPETLFGDSVFTYVRGRYVISVDTVGTDSDGSAAFRMYALQQEWDPQSVTWNMAVDTAGGQVAWTAPGGSLGALLATGIWHSAMEGADSLVLNMDSTALSIVSDPEFRGAVILADGVPSRLQATGFSLHTEVRLPSRPDTLMDHSIPGGEGAFIFDSPTPELTPGWLVGGLTSARALFRITLPDSVPTCRPAAAPCPRIPLREVNLNDVSLMLTPLQVMEGFGEVSPMALRVRAVGSPELGRSAPLGQVPLATPNTFSQIITPIDVFRHPPADTALAMRLTEDDVRRVAQANDERVRIPLALLAEPEGGYFGYARVGSEPRLRIVYTLPVQQTTQ